jgi:hypothetical protein
MEISIPVLMTFPCKGLYQRAFPHWKMLFEMRHYSQYLLTSPTRTWTVVSVFVWRMTMTSQTSRMTIWRLLFLVLFWSAACLTQHLMTLYLMVKTTPEEICKASALKNDDGSTPTIIVCKYYPWGATTNSDLGVKDYKNVYSVGNNIFSRLFLFVCFRFVGGWYFKPHLYCLPILKSKVHHLACRGATTC